MGSDLLKNGLMLMVIGMGTVFAFLTVMVLCIQASAKVAARFAHLIPEPEKKKPKAKKPAAPAAPAGDDGALVAVLTAAVAKYRAEK
ncbi:MAG: OadG family protein [Lentisphaeria bacterium]|jgi:oxaloacetate decarboxylase gamma subunit|nr:OadG family protein [Lentisphaeria bacterium]